MKQKNCFLAANTRDGFGEHRDKKYPMQYSINPVQYKSKVFSDKSQFCISFGNQGLESGGRLERHRIQAA